MIIRGLLIVNHLFYQIELKNKNLRSTFLQFKMYGIKQNLAQKLLYCFYLNFRCCFISMFLRKYTKDYAYTTAALQSTYSI